MAKRPESTTRRNQSTAATTSSGERTAAMLEERVLAFAEQLGRLAGTVQAKTAGWMDGDTLKQELSRVRDGAADLLQQITGDAPKSVAPKKPAVAATLRRSKGRSGGVVDAPGKRHRPLPSDSDASHVRSQAAKVRAAKTMVKTNRRRGRG